MNTATTGESSSRFNARVEDVNYNRKDKSLGLLCDKFLHEYSTSSEVSTAVLHPGLSIANIRILNFLLTRPSEALGDIFRHSRLHAASLTSRRRRCASTPPPSGWAWSGGVSTTLSTCWRASRSSRAKLRIVTPGTASAASRRPSSASAFSARLSAIAVRRRAAIQTATPPQHRRETPPRCVRTRLRRDDGRLISIAMSKTVTSLRFFVALRETCAETTHPSSTLIALFDRTPRRAYRLPQPMRPAAAPGPAAAAAAGRGTRGGKSRWGCSASVSCGSSCTRRAGSSRSRAQRGGSCTRAGRRTRAGSRPRSGGSTTLPTYSAPSASSRRPPFPMAAASPLSAGSPTAPPPPPLHQPAGPEIPTRHHRRP
jgi:hypothetical protein